MILAAAACAEGKGPPPPELEQAWQARNWRALPEPGGLRDQRVGELRRMAAVVNVYDAVCSHRRSTNWAEWAKRNPEMFRLINTVQRLRGTSGR